MFNPLVDNLSLLEDSEVDAKISELSRKYFQARNPDLQRQISVILEMYKQELFARREKAKFQQQDDENGLDSLIKVS